MCRHKKYLLHKLPVNKIIIIQKEIQHIFTKESFLCGLVYDCKLIHSQFNGTIHHMFRIDFDITIPNEIYPDSWHVYTSSNS